jgi:hypothetical protein
LPSIFSSFFPVPFHGPVRGALFPPERAGFSVPAVPVSEGNISRIIDILLKDYHGQRGHSNWLFS